MRGPTWTEKEKELLKELVKEDKSNREIAEIMNKPYGGIKSMRKTLGLKTRNFHNWTEEQKQYIRNNKEKTDQELADELKIDYWAIRNFKNKEKLRKVKGKWTIDDIENLKLLLPFCTHNEIGTILGKTTQAINRYCETNGFLTQPPPREINIGDVFDRLTVTSERYIKKHKDQSYGYVKVKCKCGSPEKEAQINALFSGSIRSCGCRQKELASRKSINNPIFRHDRGVPKRSYQIAKQSAKKLGREFTVTFKEIVDQFYKQDGRCALTGVKLCFYNQQSNAIMQTASLDRKDSTKGYTIDNIQWTHKIANLIKQEYKIDLVLYYCELITKYKPNPIPAKCLELQSVNKKTSFAGYGNCSGYFVSRIKTVAQKGNKEFNLTAKQIWEKFVEQNGYCALTGLEIPLMRNMQRYRHLQLASVDRLDNNKGYTIDNIQIIHKDLQFMRRRMTISDFKYWSKLIYQYTNNIANDINGL